MRNGIAADVQVEQTRRRQGKQTRKKNTLKRRPEGMATEGRTRGRGVTREGCISTNKTMYAH